MAGKVRAEVFCRAQRVVVQAPRRVHPGALRALFRPGLPAKRVEKRRGGGRERAVVPVQKEHTVAPQGREVGERLLRLVPVLQRAVPGEVFDVVRQLVVQRFREPLAELFRRDVAVKRGDGAVKDLDIAPHRVVVIKTENTAAVLAPAGLRAEVDAAVQFAENALRQRFAGFVEHRAGFLKRYHLSAPPPSSYPRRRTPSAERRATRRQPSPPSAAP